MDEEVSSADVAAESGTVDDNAVVAPEQRNTKAKSIGFSVLFRDGTVYHEKKAVNTWIQALKKIGLETICNTYGLASCKRTGYMYCGAVRNFARF